MRFCSRPVTFVTFRRFLGFLADSHALSGQREHALRPLRRARPLELDYAVATATCSQRTGENKKERVKEGGRHKLGEHDLRRYVTPVTAFSRTGLTENRVAAAVRTKYRTANKVMTNNSKPML